MFLKAIEVVLARFERKRHPQTGLIEPRQGQTACAPALTLSFAIDCDAVADKVPDPLASRLRAFAAREDEIFCALPHPLRERGGFLTSIEKTTGKAAQEISPFWDARYGGCTTAQLALMCSARYDRTGKVGYRNLITNAANACLTSKPPPEVDLWPMTLGHAISLQLAAWLVRRRKRSIFNAPVNSRRWPSKYFGKTAPSSRQFEMCSIRDHHRRRHSRIIPGGAAPASPGHHRSRVPAQYGRSLAKFHNHNLAFFRESTDRLVPRILRL